MAKRKIRPQQEARHVRLYMTMTRTPAWRDLNCFARAGYIEISSRYGGKNSNNGRIPYSGRELASNLGVSRTTAHRVFKELQDHGFIVLMKAGRYGRKRRYAAEWRLTEFPCNITGELATNAYRHWQGQHSPAAVKDFENRLRSEQEATRSNAKQLGAE